MEDTGERLPVIISGTVTDASGRILSGQTVAAFWHSVRHARPLAVGLNCALGAALMRPYIEELAKVAGDTFVSCYPNAGLPNPMSETGFDETPEVTGGLMEEFAKSGFLNIAGGCCGTTPEHIAAIAQRVGATGRARASDRCSARCSRLSARRTPERSPIRISSRASARRRAARRLTRTATRCAATPRITIQSRALAARSSASKGPPPLASAR